ncbi:hypothetical protein NP233_g9660 [Leucocoprinus birnbaumii]|uniref:Uncharacterized protein n=1 Tax=Leucocoprinus birnbaumii TaxID=56174 RepID=A0AAD5VLQ5_9AGAR|nr:hypothetical protein NP233_g9660 [Leucocoprinus birnbaumii]
MSATPTTIKNQLNQTRGQGKVTLANLDDETMTVQRGSVFSEGDGSDTATIFEAFKEVSLDLTLSFSTQNSPAASTTELPLSDHTSVLSPPSLCIPSSSGSVEAAPSIHHLSRTLSFASQLTPLSPLMKSKKKYKSAKLASDQSSILRGSWPAIKYVGRGTPVDKNRRKEWGGISSEGVGEDGLLFSDVRATSLDSRSPRVSSSSDWDFLNTGLPTPASPRSGGRSISVHHTVEEEEDEDEGRRVPPLQKIDIKLEGDTEDWASVMETVLSSADKGRSAVQPIEPDSTPAPEKRPAEESLRTVEDQTPKVELPPEEIDKLQSELQFDLNIDKALDLGFTPAVDGGTLFTLAAITDSDNSNLTIRRTTTMSTHSQYSTPSEGPSEPRLVTNLVVPGSGMEGEDSRHLNTRGLSDMRSTCSTKADTRVGMTRYLRPGVQWKQSHLNERPASFVVPLLWMGDKTNVKQIDPYKELPTLSGNRLTFKSSSPYIPQYVTSNLTATSDPAAVYSNRVQGRQLLLENPVRDARKRKEAEEKRQKVLELKERKKARGIGKREATVKGVWKLDKAQASSFLPLHHLWMSYMSELLVLSQKPGNNLPPSSKAMPSSQSMFPKLVKADFHGAIISVCQSKNPCLVGITGIIFHETENAFKIITKSNAVKLLPKQNSIFTLSIPLYSTLPPSHTSSTPLPLAEPGAEIDTITVLDRPHIQFELYGNQFRFRSADRAGRKFKHKERIEL